MHITCRSTLEIAETMLLNLCTLMLHNLSRGEAQQLRVQRREIAPQLREQALALLAVWEGTPAQIDLVYRLNLHSVHQRGISGNT